MGNCVFFYVISIVFVITQHKEIFEVIGTRIWIFRNCQNGNNLGQKISNFSWHQNHLDSLLKQGYLVLPPELDSVGLLWSLRICISNKLPVNADATGKGAHFVQIIFDYDMNFGMSIDRFLVLISSLVNFVFSIMYLDTFLWQNVHASVKFNTEACTFCQRNAFKYINFT